MASICVFTPTYNRAYRLDNLYQSLLRQTCNDFTWIVVDDGSTDTTEELVAGFIAEGKIAIRYVKTENQGKARAINTGVELCEDELFMVVDSDDYLVDTAIEWAKEGLARIASDEHVAGIAALKGKDATHPLEKELPVQLTYTGLWDLYEKHGFTGDLTLLHKTALLKQHPYEVAPGEKFICETYVYYQLDADYSLLVDNRIYQVCEYLADGLSANFASQVKLNPVGYYKHKNLCASLSTTFKGKCKETALYLVGCMFAHKRHRIGDAAHPVIAVVVYPLALALRYTVFR